MHGGSSPTLGMPLGLLITHVRMYTKRIVTTNSWPWSFYFSVSQDFINIKLTASFCYIYYNNIYFVGSTFSSISIHMLNTRFFYSLSWNTCLQLMHCFYITFIYFKILLHYIRYLFYWKYLFIYVIKRKVYF